MVKVNINRNQEGNIVSIEISGHAGSGPHGHDLVCAAVSAISFGTYNAVEKLCDTALPVEQGKQGGYLYFSVPNGLEKDIYQRIQLLLEAMIISLQTIEESYSNNITVI